ncbi:deoxyribonuclease-2-alpha, partial [Brachionus plicatilis]
MKACLVVAILVILVCSFPVEMTDELVCRNEITGEPLDWFALYKLPKKVHTFFKSKNPNPFISQGTAYAFITNQFTEWTLSELSINDSMSLSGRTMQPLYSNHSSIGYLLYNDQADQVTVVKGHTKGVLLFNENSAVWIVHSIPHFPPKKIEKEYFIRHPQCVFGQSMLCMSFKFEQLEQIGRQMLYTYPQVYDYYIPDRLKNLNSGVLDNLLSVINKKHITQPPWTRVEKLITRGGEVLLSLSKFTDFQDDLYSGLVAKTLESDLLTETWSNGPGTLRSNCTSKWNVLNIQHINFEAAGLSFSVHNDH